MACIKGCYGLHPTKVKWLLSITKQVPQVSNLIGESNMVPRAIE